MKRTYQMFLLLSLLVTVSAQPETDSFATQLSQAALSLTQHAVVYDPAYYDIAYPGGDVPSDRGVCSDVLIRAYRVLDIDLQKEVHEDMLAHFESYPDIWGLSRPDSNIDHRRVPNLRRYFERYGEEKLVSNRAEDYLPGDIVCWNLGGSVTHIGILVEAKSADGLRPMVVHNIGGGQVMEDCLFDFRIIAHFIYQGK